jgi:hypothetical protein
MRFSVVRSALAIAALAVCSVAEAGTVFINAQINGAGSAFGGPQNPDVLPGATLINIFAPKNQLTLGPGTYLITNAATTGQFSAWNFEGFPSSPNWVWSFLIADDATSKVLVDGFVSGVQPTQAAMAALTGTTTFDGLKQLSGTSTAGFQETFTLTHTTTLDFLIDDGFLSDNGGGVALNISAISTVPEPSGMTLVTIVLLLSSILVGSGLATKYHLLA